MLARAGCLDKQGEFSRKFFLCSLSSAIKKVQKSREKKRVAALDKSRHRPGTEVNHRPRPTDRSNLVLPGSSAGCC